MNTTLTAAKLLDLYNQAETADTLTPLHTLRTVIEEYAENDDITIEQAIEELADLPEYGSRGEGASVNVYQDDQGKLRGVWKASGDGTWVTLEALVEEIESGTSIPAWFDSDWYRPE